MTPELLRALHIIAVIAWVAGMLMLPRLYAYQLESEPGGELDKKMIDAARRLRVIVLTPAMAFAFIFGIALYVQRVPDGAPPIWLGLKVALALGLAGFHGYCAAEGKRLAKGERRRSARFWRMAGEIPMLIAIAIVLLAVLEPRFG